MTGLPVVTHSPPQTRGDGQRWKRAERRLQRSGVKRHTRAGEEPPGSGAGCSPEPRTSVRHFELKGGREGGKKEERKGEGERGRGGGGEGAKWLPR